MPVMDEFREERAKLKDASPKEKLDYFWYYYKWHVIISVAVLVLLVSFIHDIITRKDTVFQAAIINHYALNSAAESYSRELEAYLDIDTDKEEVYLDNSFKISFSGYSSESVNFSEKLMAQAASGSLDVMIADEEAFVTYGENFFFRDLSSVLSKEELAEYEPYLYYAGTEEGQVPLGVYLDSCTHFLETYMTTDNSRSVLGVLANTDNTEQAAAFLRFLFQNPPVQ